MLRRLVRNPAAGGGRELQMKLPAFLRQDEGSTLVITAVGMIAILAFAGLAVDVGSLRFARHKLQSAVDAAAVAAALEIPACAGNATCPAMTTAAQAALAENGFSNGTQTVNCAAPAGTGLTIMISNPPCYQGASDPNSGKSSYVEVVAKENQRTFFAGLIGFSSIPIAVRAEAQKTANPNCIYALDPTGGNAITVDLLSTITSSCGIVDESSAWNALSCNLLASLHAPSINVVGGVQGLLCLPSTAPRTGVRLPSQPDPLSAVPKPAVPACGTSISSPFHGAAAQVIVAGNATFYPDQSYCGGIILLPTANVTFEPGVYVLKSNGLLNLQGGLNISLLSNVTGTGVTFYNYGPRGAITMLAPTVTLGGVNLTAPTSGTYACMLFFQDPQNTDGANIIASASWNTYLEGIYYFPNANVLYAASLPVKYNILVAKDIEFAALSFGSTNLTSGFTNDYSSVPNGCPMAGTGGVLVQ